MLGRAQWALPNDDYPEKNDLSRVDVFREDGKFFIELSCNDVVRRKQIVVPQGRTDKWVDEDRLSLDYPICADTDANVAYVAERLGYRLL
jgi:hypothetical protein